MQETTRNGVRFSSGTEMTPDHPNDRTERLGSRDPGKSATEVNRTFGPYRLMNLLGRGGFGAVHRARHEETGEFVALKTIKVANRSQIAGIHREVDALSRLDHPGVVKIVDHGIDGALPWYAMEILEGQSLAAFRQRPQAGSLTDLHNLETPDLNVPESTPTEVLTRRAISPPRTEGKPAAIEHVSTILTVIRRLCAPLAYIHGEGIVHRDIKPDNILLRPDESVVIVDFGLSSRSGGLSREALEVAGYITGTPHYMSPEQAQGERVDARSDLYSLGCILYELLTGSPPFKGKNAIQVVMLHLNADPLPPSRSVPGLPQEIDTLVLRLLAKKPRDRIGFADDLSNLLATVGAGNGATALPAARPYLYRPGFTGREAALLQCNRLVAGAAKGEGGFALIGGESGIGKTRLANEVAAFACRKAFEVLVGQCVPLATETSAHGRSGGVLPA